MSLDVIPISQIGNDQHMQNIYAWIQNQFKELKNRLRNSTAQQLTLLP